MTPSGLLRGRLVSAWIFFFVGGLGYLGITIPQAQGQQTTGQGVDALQRARTRYQKAKAAYRDDRRANALDHVQRVEEILAEQRAPEVDTLRARRLALLSKILYRAGTKEDRNLGGAQRALIKMEATRAVPSRLADEMAAHRDRVERALMKALPQAVRASIRSGSTMDTLDLSDDGHFVHNLTGLPDSVGRLTSLRTADLSVGQLSSLPESLGQWSDLRTLNVSHNELGRVPESIGELSRLRELDLSHNALTHLPGSIGRLTNLRRLDLSQNTLSELPSSIGQLTNLRWLDVSGNELEELPSSVGRLTHLKRLDVSGNSDVLSYKARSSGLEERLSESVEGIYPVPVNAERYRWLQTAQIGFPIGAGSDAQVLLDSLKNVLVRRDSLPVRRGPAQPEARSLSALETRMIERVGVDLSSANYARIDYQVAITERGFKETIQAIHFLFTPRSGGGAPDRDFIPLLYVDAQQPWVGRFLKNNGIPCRMGECHMRPFSILMSFDRRMQRHGQEALHKIDGKAVRSSGLQRGKREFIRKIKRLTNESR